MNWISRMLMMISISLHAQRLVYDYGWIQSRSVFLACFLREKMTHPQINNGLINNDIIPNVLSTIVKGKSNDNWPGLATNKVGPTMILGKKSGQDPSCPLVLKGPDVHKVSCV